MIEKLPIFNEIMATYAIREKINEIIDVLNSTSSTVKAGMPLNGTCLPGPIIMDEEDIDPIFLEVHTPPERAKDNLISELEDRMCR